MPPPNDECSTGWCGTPHMSGGGGCGCGGGSVLVNNTDDGKTYQHTDDFDADGVPDTIDNCPYVKNRDQARHRRRRPRRRVRQLPDRGQL